MTHTKHSSRKETRTCLHTRSDGRDTRRHRGRYGTPLREPGAACGSERVWRVPARASGVVLVEIAGAAGVKVEAVLDAGVTGMLTTAAGLGFFLGLIVFCIATLRANVFPRRASAVL